MLAEAAGAVFGLTAVAVLTARYMMNPARNFPEVLGKYKHLGSSRFRSEGGLWMHCIYPAETETGETGIYTPHSFVTGIGKAYNSKFLERILPIFLSYQSHPNKENAEVLKGLDLPLIVFSHGLYGSSDMYTQLGRELASYGAMVVTIDHQDGTSSSGEVQYRAPPADLIYENRDEVREFRKPFLTKRKSELDSVLDFVGKKVNEQDKLFSNVNLNKVVLAGHSFGAAHTVTNGLVDGNVKCMLLFDIWSKPLLPDVVPPRQTLSILSSYFADGPEGVPTRQFTSFQHSYYIPNTKHTLWSDFSFILPVWANPMIDYKDPQDAHKAWVEASHFFMDHHLNDREGDPVLPENPFMVKLT